MKPVSKLIMPLALAASFAAWSPPRLLAASETKQRPQELTLSYKQSVLDKVDKIVKEQLYSKELAATTWPAALKEHKEKILGSSNLLELDASINDCLAQLKSSHCEFVTANDETYYFLHSLFSQFTRRLKRPPIDFTGFVTGGVDFAPNAIRYILDDSPAMKADLKIGDVVLDVDGHPYVGQNNFEGTGASKNHPGKTVTLTIERHGKRMTVSLSPVRTDDYEAYARAIEKSAVIKDTPYGKIGYVHDWAGGEGCHEALEHMLSTKLANVDGLVLDLRDGYGGNSQEDLDFFFRPHSAYPTFTMIGRDGKPRKEQLFFEKPTVAIANGGSRSGKEMLALGLKRSGRAKLIGETTAGAFLGGKLFEIDDKTALYLAVADATLDGQRLEAKGVEPEIPVANKEKNQEGWQKQLDVAFDALKGIMTKPAESKSDKQ